jgi:hypothetical protein
MSSVHLIPQDLRDRYEVHEWRNAAAVLKMAHPQEWDDVVSMLSDFRLCRSAIIKPGGRKTEISSAIDDSLYQKGWKETSFRTAILVDEDRRESPTHKVDCYKNRVGLEVEWNNKDTFYDRDLNNFRLLFELRTIEVGIVVTRSDELTDLLVSLGRDRQSYGATTTHMSALLPRLEGGGGGGCPVLVFGITRKLYDATC